MDDSRGLRGVRFRRSTPSAGSGPVGEPFRIRRHGSASLRRTACVLNGRHVTLVEDDQGIVAVEEVHEAGRH